MLSQYVGFIAVCSSPASFKEKISDFVRKSWSKSNFEDQAKKTVTLRDLCRATENKVAFMDPEKSKS
jgi:hypothetical protein